MFLWLSGAGTSHHGRDGIVEEMILDGTLRGRIDEIGGVYLSERVMKSSTVVVVTVRSRSGRRCRIMQQCNG